MDEGSARSIVVDLLEIYNKLVGVVLGVGEDLGAEESDDVIRNHLLTLVGEVGVVNAEMSVELVFIACQTLAKYCCRKNTYPVDLVGDQFAWDEALRKDAISLRARCDDAV